MEMLREKIGYGFGDMASSMFWKIFSYYLPFFYSNIFGLKLADAALLVLLTRIWDAISDPMMGVIADRTKSRWGKYRPYLLWFAAPFSICGILLFTTPDYSYAGKLTWAYVTYIAMMTVYTGINVPYGALLGVISDNPDEKTVYSSFRMFFAYGGSFIALFSWEPLCDFFHNGCGLTVDSSWQFSMAAIGLACLILFLCCFAMTRETVKTVSSMSVYNDFKALMKNGPWWLLIAAALSFNLFSTIRGATVAYFFADVIGPDAILSLGAFGSVLFYSGLFLGIGEIANMAGVALTVPISAWLGKKSSFIIVNLLLVIFSSAFLLIPMNQTGYWLMLILQVAICLLTGIMSPLIWSMYADVSDYSELKYKTASTGLIFSSSSMAQKFGAAFGGAAVLWLLGAYGYIENIAGGVQPASAISCLWMMMMSVIPAAVAAVAALVASAYPLSTDRMNDIVKRLKTQREHPVIVTEKDEMTDFANVM